MPNFRNLMSGDAGGAALVEVENSALFNRANSEYLSRTYGTPTDQDVFTLSMWLLPQNFAGFGGITGGAAANTDLMYISPAEVIVYALSGSGVTTVPVRRDIGWGHFVWQINGTTVKTYWNSVLVSTDTKTVSDYNSAVTHTLGSYNGNANHYNGYMAETVFIDGLALEPTSFGEYDETGLYWTPKSSDDIKDLTFGNNGFYLDNTTNAQTDASGEGNNFTNNNTVVTSKNTPTNTAATWNPLLGRGSQYNSTLSNGNRTAAVTSGGSVGMAHSTLAFDASDNFYAECVIDTAASSAVYSQIGICPADNGNAYYGSGDVYIYRGTGAKIVLGSASTYGASFTTSDVIGIHVSGGTITMYKQTGGTGSFASQGSLATGVTGMWRFIMSAANGTGFVVTGRFIENEWGNGSPPASTLALNTTNLAAATTRTQSDPYEHFANITRTGTGAIATVDISAQTPNGSDFNPGLVWSKNRVDAVNHRMFSSLLAQPYYSLRPDVTNAVSTTQTDSLTAFGTGDYTLGADTAGPVVNANTKNYIDWVFKLGGAASTNEDGTITSSVSVNTTLGMSVGTFSGGSVAAAGTSVGHGLGVSPSMVIVKNTSGAYNWGVYHEGSWISAANPGVLYLDGTAARAGDTNVFGTSGAIGASTFTVGDWRGANHASDNYMFIAFAPSEYISIGSYEGNGSATDGTFVPTLNSLGVPLQPIWTMTKNIDTTSDWAIFDAARDPYNVVGEILFASDSGAEIASSKMDYVNGGIKMRSNSPYTNSAQTLIHLTIGTPIIDVDGRIIAGR